MGKYVDDMAARHALETVAQHVDRVRDPLPFVWSGAVWTTQSGEWRDFPLIRRGMGEWLRRAAEALSPDSDTALTNRRYELSYAMDEARNRMEEAGVEDDEADRQADIIGTLREQLKALPAPARVAPVVLGHIRDVASEIEAASDARASQLLSLASQFDAFRAPLNDPATWVRNLGGAPYGVHVRTSAVWEAFADAEPVLARSLGTTTGKRALFTAMDKRFGARRKLSGYEGWRGVALPDVSPRG
ncbi:hypothetical protein [Streptomyces acidiscabies]|uniref:hypothetical protein n=1 Tax=Streptomyces acidiscabies TaxID=42234 RepID=UPI0038F74435